ncbi:hypothetical protein FA13DRAFT_1775476 [Coprinellus micaceus]|uniref:TFIIS N-terminal domain-containing protein n=1 Tax=Coprinellus micaceus TaxID=71717 RepID=A0A4Y7T5U6_COPMI|nr:hypothetical protein FA13DRAFT_1775476 [Coprinellus micaceus]
MDLFGWAAYASQDSSTSRHVQPTASSPTPAMSIDDPWPSLSPAKDHPTPSSAPQGPATTGTSSSANPPASSLDLSDFTAFDDITGTSPSATSAMLSPTNPYMHPYSNYFVGYPYAAWPVPVAPANVPLSSYSTLNGATNVGSSSSASGVPQQAQSSSQSQQPPSSSTSQSQSHASVQQGQAQPQHSPPPQHVTAASPMIVDALSMNGGSSNGNGLTFQPNGYQTSSASQPSHSQYSFHASVNPYTIPYYRQPPSHGTSGSSGQAQGQGTLSPHALHSSAGSPTNSSASSYMFPPTTGIHPGMFYGLPQPGPNAIPVSASSSSSSTPSGGPATPSSAPTSQLHSHPSQQQFQQQYHQFQLQQQQQYQQQLQQQQQQQEAAAREVAAREKEKDRREKFEKSVRPLLQSNAFSGAGAVRDLIDRIDDFGADKVDPSLRLEILQKMRDGAPNHYFRAWCENPDAMDVTREWLKSATAAKDVSKEESETVMPLLHILDRLPLNVDILKTSRIGRLVRSLVNKSPSPAIKDMASNLERRWLDLVQKVKASESVVTTSGSNPNQSSGTEGVSKKRKEPPSASSASTSSSRAGVSGNAPPSKKPAVGTSTSTKPLVKKEPTSISLSKPSSSSSSSASATKGAGADTSFFSAPKPKAAKAKLPSFKRAPIPPPAKSSTPNGEGGDDVAMPSAVDPFAEIVKAMKLKKEPLSNSPANVPTASGNGAKGVASGGIVGGKGGRRKNVTWAPGEGLVQIKYIERAVYDDDMKDGTHGTSLRDLDRGEGAALHQQGLEEAIDWSEPQALLLTEQTDHPRGEKSEEKETQEAREATALGALYMNESQIPDTPAEPMQVMPEEEVDKNVVIMTLGPDNEDLTWTAESMAAEPEPASGPMNVDPLAAAATIAAQPAVAQLLQKLAMDPSVLAQALPQPVPGAIPAPAAAESLLPQEQHLQQEGLALDMRQANHLQGPPGQAITRRLITITAITPDPPAAGRETGTNGEAGAVGDAEAGDEGENEEGEAMDLEVIEEYLARSLQKEGEHLNILLIFLRKSVLKGARAMRSEREGEGRAVVLLEEKLCGFWALKRQYSLSLPYVRLYCPSYLTDSFHGLIMRIATILTWPPMIFRGMTRESVAGARWCASSANSREKRVNTSLFPPYLCFARDECPRFQEERDGRLRVLPQDCLDRSRWVCIPNVYLVPPQQNVPPDPTPLRGKELYEE